jgi:hypothetical protein
MLTSLHAFIHAHIGDLWALFGTLCSIVLFPMLNRWLNEHLTASQAIRVEAAVQAGLQAGISAATIGKSSGDTLRAVMNDPVVRTNVVNLAASYVRQTIPTTIAKMKLDPALEQVISARVDEAVAKLAENYTVTNTAIATAIKTDIVNEAMPPADNPAV